MVELSILKSNLSETEVGSRTGRGWESSVYCMERSALAVEYTVPLLGTADVFK